MPFRELRNRSGLKERLRELRSADRGPELCGGFEAEGKIKGRDTCARRKPCLHVGWRGTRLRSRCAVVDANHAPQLVILRAWCAVLCSVTPDLSA